MSASDKKKLRKELNAAAMTERQKTEQKNQKKQKTTTAIFLAVMALVLVVVLVSALITPVTRLVVNNTVGAKVDEHELTATELNYFYVDAISSMYNQYSQYGDYQDLYVQIYTGWNPAAPADDQVIDEKTGETWADHFIESAIESAKWTYAIYDKAMADKDFKLSKDDQSAIDSRKSYLNLYGSISASGTADGYIRAIYGTSASLESYMEYYTVCYTASAYANKYVEDLTYEDKDYDEFSKDKMEEFNSYSWLSYYVKASDYLTGGTKVKDENGKETTEYSDAEKQAAIDAAKADADLLLKSESATLEDLNKAINALEINKDSKTDKTATEYTNEVYDAVSYSTPNEDALEWLTSEKRTKGEMTVIEYTTKDADDKDVVNGYYVLMYIGSIDNADVNVGTVRHLLVAFEKDKDGKVSDENKKKAKEEAEKLLKEYKDGKKTEEAFTLLISKHSDDSKDGLYENITPDSGFVEEFTNWAIADHNEGDVEIIETEYGYHIMYYVSCSELSYRDTMIKAAMQAEDYEEWEEAVLKDVKAEIVEDKHINRDFMMSSVG